MVFDFRKNDLLKKMCSEQRRCGGIGLTVVIRSYISKSNSGDFLGRQVLWLTPKRHFFTSL